MSFYAIFNTVVRGEKIIKLQSWRSQRESFLFLFCSLIVGALLSSYLGKDMGWDVANYHYYNAFAFLHHRTTVDYWPPSYIHMFFNPLADLLSYLLIQNLSPLKVQLIMGALNGINIWLIYLILNYFISPQLPYRILILLAFLSLCFTSPFGFMSLGDLRNDYLSTSFVLGFILYQLKFLNDYQYNKKTTHSLLIISGLLLGIGIGLKLTAALFFIGALAAILFTPLPLVNRFKWIFWVGLGTGIGLLMTSGYWMFYLWKIYHNPIFPFFNRFFQANQFGQDNINNYTQYLPKGWWQNIIFPFSIAFYGTPGDNSGIFHDFRYALITLLLLFNIISWRWLKIKKNLLFFWLGLFFIFSFIVWQYSFAVSRYLLPLTLLAPLLIYLLTINLISHKNSCFIFLIFFSYILFSTTTFPGKIRLAQYTDTYFNIHLPKQISSISKAYVLVAYPAYAFNNIPKPQTYLIPAFPRGWHFMGVPFENAKKTFFEYDIFIRIKKLLASAKGSIYLLTSAESLPIFYQTTEKWGLGKAGDCQQITSDRQWISNSQTVLCPLKKL